MPDWLWAWLKIAAVAILPILAIALLTAYTNLLAYVDLPVFIAPVVW